MADKSQNVRLLDIVFLGPFFLYLAFGEDRLSKPKRLTLAAIGLATIAYNYRNYRDTAVEQQSLLPPEGGVRG